MVHAEFGLEISSENSSFKIHVLRRVVGKDCCPFSLKLILLKIVPPHDHMPTNMILDSIAHIWNFEEADSVMSKVDSKLWRYYASTEHFLVTRIYKIRTFKLMLNVHRMGSRNNFRTQIWSFSSKRKKKKEKRTSGLTLLLKLDWTG